MKLYFARHGETLFNQLRLSQGWCDSPLTELGIQQGKNLGTILQNVEFDHIYSSWSERAYDTAAYINERNTHPATITKTKLLKEVNFGILEAMPDPLRFAVLRSDLREPSFISELKQGYKAFNGESFEELQHRILTIVHQAISENKEDANLLFVAHGGILRATMYTLLEDTDQVPNVLPNAGCVVIDYSNEKYTLERLIENKLCD